jgi:hypothetical protein
MGNGDYENAILLDAIDDAERVSLENVKVMTVVALGPSLRIAFNSLQRHFDRSLES